MKNMELVYAVYRYGSFSRAAEELYLSQSSRKDQRSAETVHKPDLNMCAFHRHICSDHNRLPGRKPDQTDRLSRMVFSFMNTDM